VRAAIGSPVQQTNCHPFRSGRWLFVHNGYIAPFAGIRRELSLAIAPERFPDVHGSTDTELVFQLALTYGLEDDPVAALERTVGLIEATTASDGTPGEVQATFGVSDGETVWAIRYATKERARSLFATTDVDTIRRLYPEHARLSRLAEGDRLIVSEPFADLPGVWQEIPERSAVVVPHGGALEHRPFRPQAPAPRPPAPQYAGAPDA
jgi:glutamine amidotransferase